MSEKTERICFVTSEFSPVTAGGIGAVVSAAIGSLDTSLQTPMLLLDTSAIVARRVRDYTRRELPQVDVRVVDELVGSEFPLWAFRSEAYWRSHRVWRALDRLHPLDIVEFPDFRGLGYVAIKAKRLGLSGSPTPCFVVRLHGSGELLAEADAYVQHSPDAVQTRQCERYAIEHADVLISPSTAVTRQYSERYVLPERVIKVVPAFRRTGAGDTHRLPEHDGPFEVLFVGKLQPLKGVVELVRGAVRCLEQKGKGSLHVHIVGEDVDTPAARGASRSDLEALIPTGFIDAFTFHGRLDSSSITRIADRCHAGVFPAKMESFCLAVHELNWIGIPLILSDIPAFRAYFKDREDAIFFDGSVPRLAALLAELVDSYEVLSRLRWNGLAIRDRAVADRHPCFRMECAPEQPGLECAAAARPGIPDEGPPKASIVIAYYDMHAYIDETLASVEANGFDDWEVVLVDDGSKTAAGRNKFAKLENELAANPNYRFVSKPNGGLGSARNAGIALSRGEYILPLDADDLLHPSYLGVAVAALEKNRELGFVSCYAALFPDGSRPGRAREWIIPYDPAPSLLLFEHGCGTAACVFRKTLFERVHYDEELPAYEDWDLQLSLSKAGVTGEVIPEVLSYYRVRRESMVRTRGHAEHDILISKMLDTHYPEIPDFLREAFKIYIQTSSQARGLGQANNPLSGERRMSEVVRAVYIRWFKGFMMRHLSERTHNRLVVGAKHIIGR